jgi:hypothetical protein
LNYIFLDSANEREVYSIDDSPKSKREPQISSELLRTEGTTDNTISTGFLPSPWTDMLRGRSGLVERHW